MRQERRRRWMRQTASAALLVAAAGLGWVLTQWRPVPLQATDAAARPATTTLATHVDVPVNPPVVAPATRREPVAKPRREPVPPRPVAPRVGQLVRVPPEQSGNPPAEFDPAPGESPGTFVAAGSVSTPVTAVDFPAFEISGLAGQPASSEPVLAGLWRTVTPDSFGPRIAAEVPRIPGLPVLSWRVQPGEHGDDVNAVDQLLENGQLIRTISGPAARISALVEAEEALASRMPLVASDRMTVTVRQGERMLAVSGPSQALGPLLHRVSGYRRY